MSYRKIDTRMWNDEKFCGLSDDGKLVFIFVMTHPNMTALGAMRATLPGLAAELGWLPERFREGFQEAFAKGMVEHDEKANFVALPNFLKYNPPESPNVVKAWAKCLDLLPECPLKAQVFHRAKGLVKAKGKAFLEAFPKDILEAFAKGMPYQEQEQEQEQEPYPPIQERREVSPTRAHVQARERDGQPPPRMNDRAPTWADDQIETFTQVSDRFAANGSMRRLTSNDYAKQSGGE
jgi:hypothetical protein